MAAGAPESRLELRAQAGRAVLVDDGAELDLGQLPLPGELVDALHEWARVAEKVADGDDSAAIVSRRGRQLARRLAGETGANIGYADPLSGRTATIGVQPADARQQRTPAPTPWATGLTVSAICAAIVAIALVVVTLGLNDVSTLLAFGVNIGVAAGFAPSIWLGRSMLVWRWVALGGAAGICLAWIVLLLSTLG